MYKRYMIVLTVLASIIGFIFISTASFADSSGDNLEEKYFDNIAAEYIACAAYYLITSYALEKAGEAESSTTSVNLSDIAIEIAYLAAKKTRTDEMAKKITESRLEFYTKSMLEEIDNDVSNISIIANQYTYRCKEAIEDEEAFGRKVLEETEKGQQ